MTSTATVNCHIASLDAQAFHIDAGGEAEKLISPVLVPTVVPVQDLRRAGRVDFARDSVSFVTSLSVVGDFEASKDWEQVYNRELQDLLAREICARETVVFDHILRIDDPSSLRKPARNVHSDYCPAGAHQRLRDLLGEDRARKWEAGNFAFVNMWRPVGGPIRSAPLGFVRPRSVAEADWLTISLAYPDRTGSIMGLVANEAHKWIYLSKMTPDEVAFFNIYDNRGKPTVAHSALDMTGDHSIDLPRKSIESRTLVRYRGHASPGRRADAIVPEMSGQGV